ncbi:MAG: Fe-S cluster assembly ATPase SufC [Candidatus Kariarchaeaceae archaeon]
MELQIRDLHVEVDGEKILKGVTLDVDSNKIVGLMGRNGSGKSTLAKVIFGHPDYEVTSGDILVDGESILEMGTDERARLGIFLGFQSPNAIPGVSLNNLIRTAIHAKDPDAKMENPIKFIRRLKSQLTDLGLSDEFVNRSVNENASGGERKKTEMIQLQNVQPQIAILDEIDSGLDIDALRQVSDSINSIKEENGTGFLLVTHYNRLLTLVKPDVIHLMSDGQIKKTGGPELALELEEKGYEELIK